MNAKLVLNLILLSKLSNSFFSENQKGKPSSVNIRQYPSKSNSISKGPWYVLDDKLSYTEHLKRVTHKVNKSIGLLRKVQMIVPR